MPSNLYDLTLHEARHLLDGREVSSQELTQAVLDRVQQVEPRIKSYVTITGEMALQQAKEADQAIAQGEVSPLAGVPMQLKDNMCTRGIPTTCSSQMLESFIPPYNATVVEKLLTGSAVVIGKGNMDEFAMGSSTENSAFFPTRNPWDIERVPGGSSGGPAAAVASGECIYSLGSDTGGSIRQPASFCGIVGMKPTYGLVSRYGLVAFASSLDQIGPLTKDVTDCALVLSAISGHDSRDATSIPQEAQDYSKALTGNIRGIKIGVPKEYYGEGIDQNVAHAMRIALEKLEELGASVEETSLPHTRYALAVYYILAPSEASANLARYDGVKYGYSAQDADSMWEAMERTKQHGFGPEVKRRIMLGTYALSAGYYDAYYLKAQRVRTLISREFQEAFQKYDVLITPTSPSVAFKLGAKVEDPVQMYQNDVCTIPVNIAGIPAMSLPAGFVDGLPVGMQIIGKPLAEETILRVAYTYEKATAWHKMRPEL
ncbi:MAG: Asp-tRNA(Asn)/Glu-tRNA(Gln) amidotransferase subunit GatA [Dehalococcoidia bacterium]|jgi:aspartyl-tRNA(Asn)/glutamyl-tRNA(Gln) amidotransferase subunit A|nr:Asp-tRNA(Asn)/Glu-tRNA(Gln) amidotransferase subunit GatA [Dehalococcoidia bacterium]